MMKQQYMKTVSVAVFALFNLVGAAHAAPDAQAKDETKDKPGFLTVRLSGRVMVDYVNAHARQANFDLEDLELRRAYLGLDGRLANLINYSVVGKTDSSGHINLVGFTLDWKPKGTNLKFRAGQFKTPMSLDESTSSKYTSVFERASFTDTVEIDRRVGFGVSHKGKRHTVSAGVFGGDLEDHPFSRGTAVAARATYTPISTKTQTLHVGASVRYRSDNKNDGEIRYRQRPYTHISDRIISTGRIAKSDLVLGSEVAFIRKRFWAAGEFSRTEASCPKCTSNPSFDGYYFETGVFFGGKKKYSGGSFARPSVDKPVGKGGHGAFDLVARYDSINLTDNGTKGGNLDSIILGADWYPTDHMRIGVNYFNSDARLGNRKSGLGSEFNALRKDKVSKERVKGAIFRVQYDF